MIVCKDGGKNSSGGTSDCVNSRMRAAFSSLPPSPRCSECANCQRLAPHGDRRRGHARGLAHRGQLRPQKTRIIPETQRIERFAVTLQHAHARRQSRRFADQHRHGGGRLRRRDVIGKLGIDLQPIEAGTRLLADFRQCRRARLALRVGQGQPQSRIEQIDFGLLRLVSARLHHHSRKPQPGRFLIRFVRHGDHAAVELHLPEQHQKNERSFLIRPPRRAQDVAGRQRRSPIVAHPGLTHCPFEGRLRACERRLVVDFETLRRVAQQQTDVEVMSVHGRKGRTGDLVDFLRAEREIFRILEELAQLSVERRRRPVGVLGEAGVDALNRIAAVVEGRRLQQSVEDALDRLFRRCR